MCNRGENLERLDYRGAGREAEEGKKMISRRTTARHTVSPELSPASEVPSRKILDTPPKAVPGFFLK